MGYSFVISVAEVEGAGTGRGTNLSVGIKVEVAFGEKSYVAKIEIIWWFTSLENMQVKII